MSKLRNSVGFTFFILTNVLFILNLFLYIWAGLTHKEMANAFQYFPKNSTLYFSCRLKYNMGGLFPAVGKIPL